ncbi:glycine zipper 2TM domain-containing protein [Porphyrobacter algicida]|uniref:17 kDa surface antigen n=1 Tax=Qipengyuania algicida TaxID=1836209 RepID=A0A845AJH1_9SPHN|nr:glycine zipper 2TM domain-containing protein [Qipengyuania algicida]MXP29764.1 glycine zipper 2TM domain-containing protein [Qipengyuania algicida]
MSPSFKANRLVLAIAATAAGPIASSAASAQAYDPPPPYYGDYDTAPPYADAYPPPPDYDGSELPPPPPGFEAGAYGDWTARDAAFARQTEAWSRRYCVRSRDNTAAGAVVGGLLGAIVGSSLGGRHDRGGSTLAGAAVGAIGGAAVGASSSYSTSPGCPPGYVVRRDAPTYYYPSDYDYAAPGWYRPWVYVGGSWTFRPYPYHVYYYRQYYRGGHWYEGNRAYYGNRGYYRNPGYYRDRDDYRDRGDRWRRDGGDRDGRHHGGRDRDHDRR